MDTGSREESASNQELVSFKAERDVRTFAAAERDQEADQIVGTDAGLALYGIVPDASAARLLRVARSARPRRRFHHRPGSEPDVRRAARPVGGLGVAGDRPAAAAAADRARPRPRHHDGGCAARAAGAAAALSVAHHPHGGSEPGVARKTARNAVR